MGDIMAKFTSIEQSYQARIVGNGNSDSFEWYGGTGQCSVIGTFATGTAKLQFSQDEGATWLDVLSEHDGNAISITEDGMDKFEVGPGLLRFNLSGGSGSEDVTGRIRQIEHQRP